MLICGCLLSFPVISPFLIRDLCFIRVNLWLINPSKWIASPRKFCQPNDAPVTRNMSGRRSSGPPGKNRSVIGCLGVAQINRSPQLHKPHQRALRSSGQSSEQRQPLLANGCGTLRTGMLSTGRASVHATRHKIIKTDLRGATGSTQEGYGITTRPLRLRRLRGKKGNGYWLFVVRSNN